MMTMFMRKRRAHKTVPCNPNMQTHVALFVLYESLMWKLAMDDPGSPLEFEEVDYDLLDECIILIVDRLWTLQEPILD